MESRFSRGIETAFLIEALIACLVLAAIL
jgi:hypothetical protein